MEEEKAAAYYDELTRRGEGAARYKQGLGFSSQSSDAPAKGSALPSSSSFLNSFVRASSPGKASELQKQIQLEKIQNKLQKKPGSENHSRVSDVRGRDCSRNDVNHDSRKSRHRSLSRERDRNRHSRRRSRSRSRDGRSSKHGHRSSSRGRDREKRKRRSRSRSFSDEEGRRGRNSREKRSRGRRSRSRSSEKSRGDGYKDRNLRKRDKEMNKMNNNGVDYSQQIDGYADMTPAERIKAKIKLQLSQTAEKDTSKGPSTGWERFEFNKDAPLDGEEEIEAAEDDAVLVKHIGQSFRFSAVEARKEEKIRADHDEAMFGAPAAQPPIVTDKEPEEEDGSKDSKEGFNTHLLSDKVLAKQQGSWRDRARKLQNGSKS